MRSFLKGAIVGVLVATLASAGIALAAGPVIFVTQEGGRWIVDVRSNETVEVRLNGSVLGVSAGSGPSAEQLTTVAGRCEGGTAFGPAIVETTFENKPAVVRVALGWTWSIGRGGCFAFPNQVTLDQRWQAHKAEFLRKFPDAFVIGE